MKPGQEVVCISEKGFWFEPYPRVGDIDLITETKISNGNLWIRLARYQYKIGVGPYSSVGFRADNFRPVIDINGEMTENIEIEQLV